MLPSRVLLLIRRATGLTSIADLFKDGSNGLSTEPFDLWGGSQRLVRRNLLNSTATLATQTRAVAALSHTLYLKGTGSVTLSGAATGTLAGTGASDRVSLVFTPTAGNLTLTVSGSVTEGHLTETRTADHTYQAVTDWTTEQYQYAATTQYPWLRRNIATYTADFSNSAWGKYQITATSSTITATATNDRHHLSRGLSSVSGTTYCWSFELKADSTHAFLQFNPNSESTIYANFNLINGTLGNYASCTPTITSLGSGWYRCSIVFTATVSGSSLLHLMFIASNTQAKNLPYNASGTESFSIRNGSITVGVSEYQPIGASWDAQYAADEAAANHVPVLFQDRSGTNPCNADGQTVGKALDKSGRGNHATAAADANRPLLKQDGNGFWYTQGDLVDDALVAQFTTNQGTACAEYVSGASSSTETTGITINTTRSVHGQAANYGTVIRTATESDPKRSQLLKLLDKLAGR